MARKTAPKPTVSEQDILRSTAHAVATGDVVNFRYLFLAYSPLRQESTENLHTEKYAYLLPPDEHDPLFREALELMKTPALLGHVQEQLEKDGPPQLPWEPLMLLADNAVRLGKYSAAAQAYELLRIRRRMQEIFLARADTALDAGDLAAGVRGYITAVGLDYDYAAFPEPLPAVPNYQATALILHGEYPRKAEDAVALQAPEDHVRTALNYLLMNVEIAGRLEARPLALKQDFLVEWIRRTDPEWDAFAGRYREACDLVRAEGERLERAKEDEQRPKSLEEEVAAAAAEEANPKRIPACLAGITSLDLEWWQYLKETAYRHPASALFVSRQAVSHDTEIIMPRYRSDSVLVRRLGLVEA